ncbi:hypothetical protein LTR62_000906 [Meristemomyces frigidus]|uniref:Uncharacterized protein n=1 Tax=Meristemomyces frigidus TaxID=1508187 RepID=A0AAN7T9V0_9PEZI|nr:hypothetical protein LTR62_000906 [Meristemomyces frigidus]
MVLETAMILLQCIYQTGPPSDTRQGERPSHAIICTAEFGSTLHRALDEALQRIKENWESAPDLSILIKIGARLLSLSQSEDVRASCLGFLQAAGQIALRWVEVLRAKAQQCAGDQERNTYEAKTAEIALVCADSFNVDGCHLSSVLGSTQQTSTLLKCCLAVHAGNHTLNFSEKLIKSLHIRHQQLVRRCYTILAVQSDGVSDAVSSAWSAFRLLQAWTVLSDTSDNWVTTKSGSKAETEALDVHFDLLNGELLVNGLPLNRLPARYERHPTYCTLFGYRYVKVMPSNVPGMQFSGENNYAGYVLDFGMDIARNNMMVRTQGQDTTYEILPSSLFCGALPTSFVEEFVHWYDFTTKEVEFRPRSQPWATFTGVLRKEGDCGSWRLHLDEGCLVGLRSRTSTVISAVLSSLSAPPSIHIIVTDNDGKTSVQVPRLQLTFTLAPSKIELLSEEFPGESVDPNQSAGTLVGFRNKLMLRHKQHTSRRLLLVEAPIMYQNHNGHVCVKANTEGENPIVHAF